VRPGSRYIPLFWRIFIPNVTVLSVAGVVLAAEPANGKVAILLAGFLVMLTVNLAVMRRSFAPLARLAEQMQAVDPLEPGQRVPVYGPPSEVTLVAGAFNDMLDRLETERRESARRELSAQQAVLRDVARDLHDAIGQDLTAIALMLDRVATGGAPPEQAAQARDAALEAVEKVRRIVRRLRPELLEDLGLKPALAELCRRLSERSGIGIECALQDPPYAIDPDAALVVFRVVQEGLTNVMRHSGATRARVTLEAGDDGLVAAVQDDGGGFRPDGSPSSGGMLQMRERALLVGGMVSVESAPGKGTRVSLTVPRASL
jgi:two-component system sensor histidine kinase UhpB